jgi:hypothetical protein
VPTSVLCTNESSQIMSRSNEYQMLFQLKYSVFFSILALSSVCLAKGSRSHAAEIVKVGNFICLRIYPVQMNDQPAMSSRSSGGKKDFEVAGRIVRSEKGDAPLCRRLGPPKHIVYRDICTPGCRRLVLNNQRS